MVGSFGIDSKRELWVDVAKGIAMIAIVLGHIHYNYPAFPFFPINTLFFWLWHVPVFFLMAGFFLQTSRLLCPKSFIINKYKRIGVKVVILSVPLIVAHNWLISIGFYDTSLSIGGSYVSTYSLTTMFKKVIGTVIMHDTEIIVDPLWFAQVLFWAFALLSIVSYILKMFKVKEGAFNKSLTLILLLLALGGNLLNGRFGINILPPPVGRILTATWLIYFGYKLYNYKTVSSFDNSYLFLLSIIIVYAYAVLVGPVNIKNNSFSDIISLTISSSAALYIISFLSKRIKGGFAIILSAIGKNSFYVMGLHLIAFKPCTLLLNCFGYDINIAQTHAMSPDLFSYFIYALGGIFLPIVLVYVVKKVISLSIKVFK